MTKKDRWSRVSRRAKSRRRRHGRSSRRPLFLQQLEDRRLLAVFTVDNLNNAGAGSLRQAIIDANTGGDPVDDINFQAGLSGPITLTSGEMTITSSLNINGPGAGVITVSGNNASRIFNIDDSNASNLLDVEIVGLTLTGGNATGEGGAILNRENFALREAVLTGNNATGSGGALASEAHAQDAGSSSRLIIENSTFTNNIAGSSGGAINVNNDATGDNSSVVVEIRDSALTGNSASTLDGGGIALDSDGNGTDATTSTTLQGLSITGNMAGFGGGGIDSDMDANDPGSDVTLSIIDSDISNNASGLNTNFGEGGGLVLGNDANDPNTSVTVTIRRTTITGNSTNHEGGGIESDDDANDENSSVSLTIEDSDISGNTVTFTPAGGEGGGIYLDNDASDTSASVSIVVRRTTITGNSAATDGGGLYSENDTVFSPAQSITVLLDEVTIANNTAGGDGGGIWVEDDAVAADTNVSFTIQGSTITGNTAARGGGIFSDIGARRDMTTTELIIRDTLIGDNYATTAGGGLYILNEPSAPYATAFSATTIVDSEISRNRANGPGGGIYNRNADRGSLTITGGTIHRNRTGGSSAHGGGLSNYNSGGGVLSISGTVVEQNSVGDTLSNGGGIYNRNVVGGSFALADATVFANSSAGSFSDSGDGGGVFNTNVGGGSSTITRSMIANNNVGRSGRGGGVFSSNSGGGSFSVEDTTISSNLAGGPSFFGSTGSNGGGLASINSGDGGSLSITGSTISENRTRGLNTRGEGLYTYNNGTSTTTITGSTISNNPGESNYVVPGGGIFNVNKDGGGLTITASTITENGNNSSSTDSIGGGLYNLNDGVGGATSLRSTIISGNSPDGPTDPDVHTAADNGAAANASAEFTLIGDVGAATIVDGGNNQIGGGGNAVIDALLAPLTDNGGPTHTHLLLPDSPALDAGSAFGATTEQRGFVRTADIAGITNADDGTDIGAVEGRWFTVDALGDDVDGDFSGGQLTIREAVQEANTLPDGDAVVFDLPAMSVIQLDDGEIPVTEHLVIDGPNAMLLSIDALGLSRIFNIDDGDASNLLEVSLSDLTITGGNAVGDGGGVLNSENFTLRDSVITGNTATVYGGGVRTGAEAVDPGSSTRLLIERTVFTNNYSGFRGGGLAVEGNNASGEGSSVTVEIRDSVISGNTAASGGGGLYLESDANGANTTTTTTVQNLSVTGNYASGPFADGGGLESDNDVNSDDGGANVTLTILDSDFSNNRAGSTAGAAGDGGGIYFNDDMNGLGGSLSIIVRRTTITGNSAADEGGGIADDVDLNEPSGTMSMLFDELTISNNTAADEGGGFYTDADVNEPNVVGAITITRSTISGNTAARGGGIYSERRADPGSTAELTIRETLIANNTATAAGGAVYLNDTIDPTGSANITFENSTISGNSANLGGGAIFARDVNEGSITILASTITQNVADADTNGSGSGGGIVWDGTAALTLQNTIVAGNTDNTAVAPDIGDTAQPITASFSLVGDNTGSSLTEAPVGFPDASGNLIGDPGGSGVIDPLLGPLENNGGPTLTHALLAGSPARDAGDSFGLRIDQRGGLRPAGIPGVNTGAPGDGADMGAVEGLSIVVNQTGDVDDGDPNNGLTTLREAVAITNNSPTWDRITFNLPNPSTITLGGTELLITDSLVIDGPGMDALTIDGNGASRVIRMDDAQLGASSELVLRGVTLRGGDSTSASGNPDGGGLLTSENLTIQASRVTGNTASHGGGIYTYAYPYGIGSAAHLVIEDSVITSNSTTSHGGGVYIKNEGQGWRSRTTATISNSTISGNTSDGEGGGIYTEMDLDAPDSVARLMVRNTHVRDNSVGSEGGGLSDETDAQGTRSSIFFTVEDSEFTGNSTSLRQGGGLFWDTDAQAPSASLEWTFRRTLISGNSAFTDGGGIQDESDAVVGIDTRARLTFEEVQITGNTAAQDGGGIGSDGDARDPGSRSEIMITDSLISGNSAGDAGGGAYSRSAATNRGAESFFIIKDSTIRDNTALRGGGFYLDPGFTSPGLDSTNTTTIVGTTISGNTATGTAGGIYHNDGGELHIVKSTISGNTAVGRGGGVYKNSDSGPLRIEHSTIAGNVSYAAGGGVLLAANTTATLRNALVAKNTAVPFPDVFTDTGASFDAAYTLIGDISQGPLIGGSVANIVDNGNNQFGNGFLGTAIDPLLGPLQDNGGPTETHSPQVGSPAIDAGNAFGTTVDQRGAARPFDIVGVNDPPPGDSSDIGAVEFGSPVPSEADLSISKVDDVDPVVAGNTLVYTITVNNAGPQTAENVVVTETLPAGVTFASTSGCAEDPGGVPACSLGDIAAGDSAQYTITVTVDPTTTGTITNTASVSSDTFDPDPGNNSTTEETEVLVRAFFVSSDTGGIVSNIVFDNEDILAYEPVSGQWSMYLDGSQVGLSTKNVDAFHVLPDGSILMSIDSAIADFAGLGRVEDSDVIRFIPTALGTSTAGTFEWYLDGSDVGLSPTSEDITAITLDPTGRLVVSTVSNHVVPTASGTSSGTSDDLIVFNASQLGQDSIGTWEKYFDGSDIGLSADNIYGASIIDTGSSPLVHLTTKNSFSVSSGSSLSGDNNDVFSCQTSSIGETTACSGITELVDMDSVGFVSENLDGFQDGSFTGQEVFGNTNFYFSSDGSGSIGGVNFVDDDIIVQDTSTGAWSMYFDGSDVGIIGDVNAFHIEPSGDILISLKSPQNVSGLGSVASQDIVRFSPTMTGDDTAGSFSLFLDGSDVGLSSSGENIDSIGVDPITGDLVISTIGNHDVPATSGTVTGNNRDLIRFEDIAFGSTTIGTWSSFLLGASVGLNATSEDISGLWLDPGGGDTFVNTLGSYSVPGLSGGRADVFAPSTAHLIYDGTANGIGSVAVDGIFVEPQTPAPPPLPLVAEGGEKADPGQVMILKPRQLANVTRAAIKRLDEALTESLDSSDSLQTQLPTALPQAAVDRIMSDDEEEVEAVTVLF